ncbi:MAG: Pycsar system effector family protein [Actinomycetota bacterium]
MTERDEYVARLLGETRDEVTRADTKASIVLAAAGIVVGVVLTGLVTGDLSTAGECVLVAVLAWASGGLLLTGVCALGTAVFPNVGKAEAGHARWFTEIEQHGNDDEELARAIEADRLDGQRDLHQLEKLSAIVGAKYRWTKRGMVLVGGGLVAGGLAGLISLYSDAPKC